MHYSNDPEHNKTFNSPSSRTPDNLLEQLGEHGLADLQTDIRLSLEYAERQAAQLRIELTSIETRVHSLRADQSAVQQAQQLGKDKGLE